MAKRRTVHVLTNLLVGAPLPAALCAAGVAVGAAVAEQSGQQGVSDPYLAAPFFAPRPARRGRSRPTCMSRSSGETAQCR